MIPEKIRTRSGIVKFSIIAFCVSEGLGFLSLGMLGGFTYYLISPIFPFTFPDESTFHGDWVWPTVIFISILWPFGLGFAAIAYNYFSKRQFSKFALIAIYSFVVWFWILFLWYFFLRILSIGGPL